MELAGDEKRIQALFSELRFEDQSMAPSFDRLWKSARSVQPQRVALVQPLVVLGALATIAVFFALGLRSPEPTIPVIAHVSAPLALPSVASRVEVPKKSRPRSHRTVHRRSRMNESEHIVIQQAELLASWQSPTSGLMESAAGSLLNSLPALTDSVKELESYLSINEVKELKQ
jgi:hypothetical protein